MLKGLDPAKPITQQDWADLYTACSPWSRWLDTVAIPNFLISQRASLRVWQLVDAALNLRTDLGFRWNFVDSDVGDQVSSALAHNMQWSNPTFHPKDEIGPLLRDPFWTPLGARTLTELEIDYGLAPNSLDWSRWQSQSLGELIQEITTSKTQIRPDLSTQPFRVLKPFSIFSTYVEKVEPIHLDWTAYHQKHGEFIKTIARLDSRESAQRFDSIMTLYLRSEYSNEEQAICAKWFQRDPRLSLLGAFFHIGEISETGTIGLDKEVSNRILRRFNDSNWKNPIWTGVDYRAWTAAGVVKATRPSPSKVIVPEIELLEHYEALVSIFIDVFKFYETREQITNSILTRSQFHPEEIEAAKQTSQGRFTMDEQDLCNFHILKSTYTDQEIKAWCTAECHNPRFEKEWQKISRLRSQRLAELETWHQQR